MTTIQHHQQSTGIGQVHQYVTPRRVIDAMTATPTRSAPSDKSIGDQILGNPPFSSAPTRFNA